MPVVPTPQLILSDHLGSPRLVVDTSSGTVVETMSYDELGNESETLSAPAGYVRIPFGFAGGLYDLDTKLVRFGARDYDASIGRWTTKDPIRFAGGINIYLYCENDPINCIDPTGLFDFWDTAGRIWASPTSIVGAALGDVGWLLGGQAPTIGNNGLEYRGNPLIGLFTPALTLGNTILYAENNPSRETQQHELQHTYQGEILGPLYLPAHIFEQGTGLLYSVFDTSHEYTDINDRVHSAGNLLEAGPQCSPPRPWP
jgi:RHS repeat-associated protein